MTEQEFQANEFAELAEDLLAAGRSDELIEQLADPELAPSWRVPEVLGVVAEAFGRYAAPGRLLDVATLGGGPAGLLLPVPGSDLAAAREAGDALEIDGVLRGSGAELAVALLGSRAVALPLDELSTTPVSGFDPAAELRRVSGRLAVADCEDVDLDTQVVASQAARFLAHELVGTAYGALALALDHVGSRHQFGSALGSFQAVKQRLAECHVQITSAQELLSAIGPSAGVDVHVLVLKSAAGAAAATSVATAQQVCGGMGFTEEFGLHRFVRRAHLLDSLLGGWEASDELLGRLALEGRVLPDREVVLA